MKLALTTTVMIISFLSACTSDPKALTASSSTTIESVRARVAELTSGNVSFEPNFFKMVGAADGGEISITIATSVDSCIERETQAAKKDNPNEEIPSMLMDAINEACVAEAESPSSTGFEVYRYVSESAAAAKLSYFTPLCKKAIQRELFLFCVHDNDEKVDETVALINSI